MFTYVTIMIFLANHSQYFLMISITNQHRGSAIRKAVWSSRFLGCCWTSLGGAKHH